MLLSRIIQRATLAVSLGALVLVAGTPAHAAPIGVNEPFDGQNTNLSTQWTFSGTGPPSVVQVAGQTPESALRLTSASTNQTGLALYNEPIPTRQGLDIQFNLAQWGGVEGANGLAFFVKDAANTDNTPGNYGAALGYTLRGGDASEGGLPGGLLGIGFDSQGAFDRISEDGDNCQPTTRVADTVRNKIAIRGPGQINPANNKWTNGYCLLAPPVALASDFPSLPLFSNVANTGVRTPYGSRADASRAVRVVIDSALVANPKVRVWYGLTAQSLTQILVVDLPVEMTTVPNVKIGFTASTGSIHNNHEIWNVTTAIANPEISASDEPSGDGESGASSATVVADEPNELAATGNAAQTWGVLGASIVALSAGAALYLWGWKRRTRFTTARM